MMKKKGSIFALTLLLICMLSIAFNTALVKALDPGEGKYLTIIFVGEGSVNALKVKSGQSWVFESPADTEKVGAGTVELTAVAAEGWTFSHWIGDVSTPLEMTTDYKTEKYGEVTVVFVKTFKITASKVGQGTIDPTGEVIVNAGDDKRFDFIPYDDPLTPEIDNHISAIIIDGVYNSSFATEYTFYDVSADHTIQVVFDLEGQTTVPSGNPNVFLAPTAGMAFTGAVGGIALGGEENYALGAGAWEIIIDFAYDGITLTLTYDDTGLSDEDELALFLVKAETIEALRSDVNGDLVVNGDDVSDVANAVKHLQWYDLVYDINNDSFVNEEDVHIVNMNKGAILEPISAEDFTIDISANTITFSPEHLCIFGVR